jgi:hypothetical protein
MSSQAGIPHPFRERRCISTSLAAVEALVSDLFFGHPDTSRLCVSSRFGPTTPTRATRVRNDGRHQRPSTAVIIAAKPDLSVSGNPGRAATTAARSCPSAWRHRSSRIRKAVSRPKLRAGNVKSGIPRMGAYPGVRARRRGSQHGSPPWTHCAFTTRRGSPPQALASPNPLHASPLAQLSCEIGAHPEIAVRQD